MQRLTDEVEQLKQHILKKHLKKQAHMSEHREGKLMKTKYPQVPNYISEG